MANLGLWRLLTLAAAPAQASVSRQPHEAAAQNQQAARLRNELLLHFFLLKEEPSHADLDAAVVVRGRQAHLEEIAHTADYHPIIGDHRIPRTHSRINVTEVV